MRRQNATRRRVLKGIGVAGIAGLAGCSGGGDGGDGSGSDGGDGGDGSGSDGGDGSGSDGGDGGDGGSEEPFTVGMVYTEAGLGDQGFNDSAAEGMQRAQDELNVEVTEAEPEGSEQYSTFLREFAQSNDLVCGLSFEMLTPIQEVASQFPDQRFTIVDAGVDASNVASYLYKEHEGCYLVGQMNGMLTQMGFSAGSGSTVPGTNSVGFIGGKKNPVIEKFHAGYKAGVEAFDAEIDFRSAYAGTWTSPSKGKSIAESMYNEGADIVFPAAGGTGLGAFQAAQEQERFALGVDKEQSKATPEFSDVILGSMVKRVGEAFFQSIQNTIEGSHQGGEQVALGVEREGVDLVLGDQLGSELPADVTSAVDEARQGIIGGDISVPATLE